MKQIFLNFLKLIVFSVELIFSIINFAFGVIYVFSAALILLVISCPWLLIIFLLL
jgi:hypothetical protein